MEITGENYVGSRRTGKSTVLFSAVNPLTGENLPHQFHEATVAEVTEAVEAAEHAFPRYGNCTGNEKATFLEAIADAILGLGDLLIRRCTAETGLPEARVTGERGRTVNQLRLFARLLREGSWVDARIDTAAADIRSMKRPLGPVGIFGAVNFPLAFSVAGGDTASALAAGCPVVIKAHPGHPGTCELVFQAMLSAAERCGIPDGAVNLVQGRSHTVGMAIVEHPLIRAVGFTGSFHGGKALYDAAVRREEPIPVYAEMGSTNPVFVLPGAAETWEDEIVKGFTASVTLGSGQFCTNPGLLFLQGDTDSPIVSALERRFTGAVGGAMAGEGVFHSFTEQLSRLHDGIRVRIVAEGTSSEGGAIPGPFHVRPVLLHTEARQFQDDPGLDGEVFGPSSLMVTAESKEELVAAAHALHGQLTATVWGTEADFRDYFDLIEVLKRKVGRLIVNGFPTGVEVCHAMVHGGPFPATTDSRSTSVGTRAIDRFTRPFCYQNVPDSLLPDELRDGNPLGIRRMVNGMPEDTP